MGAFVAELGIMWTVLDKSYRKQIFAQAFVWIAVLFLIGIKSPAIGIETNGQYACLFSGGCLTIVMESCSLASVAL